MNFVTVHLLRALPMHNLNRDQNGLPKSQFDGGVQRGRLSSQSIKKPARIRFGEAVADVHGASGSLRTMDSSAAKVAAQRAAAFAEQQGKAFDAKVAAKTATAVVRSLAKKSAQSSEKESSEGEIDKKDNILLFAEAELDTLAQALVDEQNGGSEATTVDFIQDFVSPALDVACFGRMFAAQANKSTQAAIAVSHAVMTHEMSLTIDYFTAVDEFEDETPATDAGAGHLGLAYYTSGVYYSTFTIDPDQLRRSWTAFGAPSAKAQVKSMVRALIEALPTGKLTNTNAHSMPFLVLVEDQLSRTVYGFETPVTRAEDGGFAAPSTTELIRQMTMARAFDPQNYRASLLYSQLPVDHVDGVENTTNLEDLVDFTTETVFAEADR